MRPSVKKTMATLAIGAALFGATQANAALIFLGPSGANDRLNAYQAVDNQITWINAKAAAAAANFGGQPGHLATVRNISETVTATRMLNGNSHWVGYTDQAGQAPGATEGGNQTNFPVVLGRSPTATERGFGWAWVNGEPNNFNNWNGNGEPNNCCAGENFAEIITNGTLNDLDGNATRRYIQEFETQYTSPNQVVAPGFLVTVVRPNLDGQAGASRANGTGLNDINSLIYSASVPGAVLGSGPIAQMNLHNTGGNGNFGNDIPYPGTTINNDVEDFYVLATGTINVNAAGNYQFRLTGDDGGLLRIDGVDVIIDQDFHGVENRDSAIIPLTAGQHTVQWVNFDGCCGGTGEAAYRPENGTYVPIGDASQGISAVLNATTFKVLPAGTTVDNLATAIGLVNGTIQTGQEPPSIGVASVLNMVDGGGNGHFGNDDTFMGITGDDYALKATGLVFIPADGFYTFGTNTDDGVRLVVDGNTLINFDQQVPPTDNFGSTFLTSGFHPIELIYFERAGGAALELFAAAGQHTSFTAANFQLVGNTQSGGLLVVTNLSSAVPEPASALLALGGIGVLGLRRRRNA